MVSFCIDTPSFASIAWWRPSLHRLPCQKHQISNVKTRIMKFLLKHLSSCYKKWCGQKSPGIQGIQKKSSCASPPLTFIPSYVHIPCMSVNIYELQVCFYTYAYAQTWYVWTLVRVHLHDVILVQVQAYKSRFAIKTNQKTITLHVSLSLVSSNY